MKILKVKKGDALLDLGKLNISQKIILFPFLVKLFGLLKATILLYGSSAK